jgi:hypothetical protein
LNERRTYIHINFTSLPTLHPAAAAAAADDDDDDDHGDGRDGGDPSSSMIRLLLLASNNRLEKKANKPRSRNRCDAISLNGSS